MNFIVKLSLLNKSLTNVLYNSILIIVNWLTKKARFISYLEALDTKELAYTFL